MDNNPLDVPYGLIADFERWLLSTPECVQMLAAEFPPGTIVEIEGKPYGPIGYSESDSLILCPIPPPEDYQEAQRACINVCASHLRDGTVKFTKGGRHAV